MNEKFLPAARKKFMSNVARQYSTSVSRLVNFERCGKDAGGDARGAESGDLREVKAADATPERAEEIGSDGINLARDVGNFNGIEFFLAVDGHDVADGGVRHLGGINGGKVHRDRSHDGYAPAAQKHGAIVRALPDDTIRVSRGNDGDARRALGNESRTVADGLARGNFTERYNSRAK
jgi:hypothetical protein